MDFNNNVQNNSVQNNAPNNQQNNATGSIDIRDVATFLFSKIWIIALVVLCFAIVAFLWTTFFVDEVYNSTTDLFIISTIGNTDKDGASSTTQANNWSIGKQLTKTSQELIMGDYCDLVAKELNAHNPNDLEHPLTKALNQTADDPKKPLVDGISFKKTFEGIFGETGITGSYIRSHIKVSSDEETCIVAVTASTGNAELSSAISNAVLCLFDGFINDFMSDADSVNPTKTVRTQISSSGRVPGGPSNANSTRNALIFGIVGAILICAILIIIFIFDDKIKTPDDVEKHLGLSILGAIPEIDEA